MAKRHHSGHREGHMSSRPDTEMYAGRDSRRYQEYKDASMLHEDHNAIANMPQHVIMKEYPKSQDGMNWTSDDTINGIAEQMKIDHGKMKMDFAPKKV